MLSGPVPGEGMQSVARRHPEVPKPRCQVNVFQSPCRPADQVRRQPSAPALDEQPLRLLVGERLDHVASVACNVTRVKRGRGRIADAPPA